MVSELFDPFYLYTVYCLFGWLFAQISGAVSEKSGYLFAERLLIKTKYADTLQQNYSCVIKPSQ